MATKLNVEQVFSDLKATSSRLEKEKILKSLDVLASPADRKTFKLVLFLALDPLTQFYQRKIPKYTPAKKAKLELADALVALGDLSSRKVTGNAAIDYLQNLLESVNADDAKVLERIIQKDLDCGVQASTVNKIWENLILEYPCMLASGFDEKLVNKVEFPAIVQLKMDGMRFNAVVDANSKTVEYRSRNGKQLKIDSGDLDDTFLEMAKNIGMSQVVFDGELVVADTWDSQYLDRKTGNGILNKAVKGTISQKECDQVRAVIWDVIPLRYFREGKCDVDYETRLATVATAVENLKPNRHAIQYVRVVETVIANSLDHAKQLFEMYHSAGQEGIILKDRNGPWEDKRAKHQIKFKGELECDLICVGWEEGTGKNKGKLGALVLRSSDAKVNVAVGTGLTDELRATLKEKDVVGKVVTIKYNARINNKKGEDSLFLPVFLEIREDKSEADSSRNIK
jgi:hypothetical protein